MKMLDMRKLEDSGLRKAFLIVRLVMMWVLFDLIGGWSQFSKDMYFN
jgi:hypothetical protein